MWNLHAPPEFRGFDETLPVRFYRRHLPHWRQEGATYFVTFRLADALPQNKLRELAALREQWLRKVSEVGQSTALSYGGLPHDTEFSRTALERVERWLDEGQGSCVLSDAAAAKEVERCLRHEDGKGYDLIAFVVMPNHVHLLARPYSNCSFPLERLEQGWKSFSARAINRQRGVTGTLWQDESFDRIVRDEEHLFRCVQYIGANPRRAGLRAEGCLRYIREDWHRLGWGFQDP